ncbi:MAG: sigma-70 family RNA polymerase sigma factor [Eubacteriales bacterium]|nr:sigma-70 family RNA polymerase sigma factor [Eubacteriales bacterium]
MVWEEEKIREIYDRNFDSVYRVCLIYMKNREEALDMVQETFMKLMQKRMTDFTDEHHLDAWLRVVASNLCRNELHHWWRRRRTDMCELDEILKNQTSEEEIREREEKKLFLSALLELPEKYRVLIYFHYYEEYTIEELGRWMKINPSTLRSRLAKGKELLGKKLKEAGVYEG